MIPTIGRVLWYWPLQNEALGDGRQPCTALVCYVHSPTLVNLAVFDHNGGSRGRTSVKLLAPGEAPPKDSAYAVWPHKAQQDDAPLAVTDVPG